MGGWKTGKIWDRNKNPRMQKKIKPTQDALIHVEEIMAEFGNGPLDYRIDKWLVEKGVAKWKRGVVREYARTHDVVMPGDVIRLLCQKMESPR